MTYSRMAEYKAKILKCGDARIKDEPFRASDVVGLLKVSASHASDVLTQMVNDGTVMKIQPGKSNVLRYAMSPKARPLRDKWRREDNNEIGIVAFDGIDARAEVLAP